MVPRCPPPQEPGVTRKPLAGPLVLWLEIRLMRKGCATRDGADLFAGRVFETSVLDGRNTHNVLYLVPSCILPSGARYTPPIFRQLKAKVGER